MGSATRMLLFTFAVLTLVGIWLTGFNAVHWFLYVPPAVLLFAAVTGICPGLALYRKLGFK